jgi:ribonuclease/clavin/mitogillin
MIDVYVKEDVTCIEGTIRRSDRDDRKIYSYLVDGMLIDTGAKWLENELVSFYENHSIELVTLTHSHEDHTGNASWLQQNQNVPIYVHPIGISTCAQPCPYPKYRQVAWGVRDAFNALPLGDMIQSRSKEWKVIYTPGHADDHVSLLDEETGRLFSGDIYVTPRTKVIMENESIPILMSSIRTLLSHDFEAMFCAHAGYIQNGREMLQKKLDYLENLCGEVKHLHEEGRSIAEINTMLFPKKYPIVTVSEGQWDSVHIVTSIISALPKRLWNFSTH